MMAIIAGSRSMKPTRDDVAMLDTIRAALGVTLVVSGGAPGADSFGEAWASRRGLPVKRFPADWNRYGRAAGPLRNEQMAKFVAGHGVCVLFPGGIGTASMRKIAQRENVPVIETSDELFK